MITTVVKGRSFELMDWICDARNRSQRGRFSAVKRRPHGAGVEVVLIVPRNIRRPGQHRVLRIPLEHAEKEMRPYYKRIKMAKIRREQARG